MNGYEQKPYPPKRWRICLRLPLSNIVTKFKMFLLTSLKPRYQRFMKTRRSRNVRFLRVIMTRQSRKVRFLRFILTRRSRKVRYPRFIMTRRSRKLRYPRFIQTRMTRTLGSWSSRHVVPTKKVRDHDSCISAPIQPRKKKHQTNVSSALKTF